MDWVIERWTERPELSRAELVKEAAATFWVSKGTAERLVKGATDRLRQKREEWTIDRLANAYFELADRATRSGQIGEARRCLDSLRSMLGIGKPDRLEIVPALFTDEQLDDMTDEQLEVIAGLAAAKVAKEMHDGGGGETRRAIAAAKRADASRGDDDDDDFDDASDEELEELARAGEVDEEPDVGDSSAE